MSSTKLDKNVAYKLVEKLLKHWTFQDYCLENEQEYVDDFLREIGQQIFEAALEWQGGTSFDDKRKWLFTPRVEKLLYRLTQNYSPDDFAVENIETIATTVLSVVKEFCEDFTDSESKVFESEVVVVEKLVKEYYTTCPNCSSKFEVYKKFNLTECRRCGVKMKLSGGNDERKI